MDDQNPARLQRLVLEAIRLSGQRAIVLAGWSGLAHSTAGEAAASVYFSSELPHSWLFPRVAAVVHHGGAGTTMSGAACSRTGVPEASKKKGFFKRGVFFTGC